MSETSGKCNAPGVPRSTERTWFASVCRFRVSRLGGLAILLLVVSVSVVLVPAAASPAGASGTWSSQPIPSGTSNLNGVTCLPTGTSYDCWAVGQSADGASGVIIASTNGGSSWTSQAVPATVNALSRVSCVSLTQCWAVGQGGVSQTDGSLRVGVVVATFNGGKTWTKQNLPPGTYELHDVSCVSTGPRCWAVEPGPHVVQTADGGSSWTVEANPLYPCANGCDSYDPAAVAFANKSDGWIGAFSQCGGPGTTQCGGAIYATTDGGSSWSAQLGGCQGPGSGAGCSQQALPSVDGISCPNSTHCWAVANTFTTGEIYRTTDGGSTWSKQTVPNFSGILTGISCDTSADDLKPTRGKLGYRCWAVGDNYQIGVGKTATQSVIMTTTDNGATWIQQSAPSGTTALYGVTAVGINQAWAAGQNLAQNAGRIITSGNAAPANPVSYSLYTNIDSSHPPAFYRFSVPHLGAEYGMVTIAFFISAAELHAAPGVVGLGDGRGFASQGKPPPDKVRVAFTLDFATGSGVMRINPTCAKGPAGCGGPNDIHVWRRPIPDGYATQTATNDILAEKTADGVLLDLEATNGAATPLGAWLLGEIHSVIAIKAEPYGNLKGVLELKAFPSTEAYQLAKRNVRTLIRIREQGWNASDPIDRAPNATSLQHSPLTKYFFCTDRKYCK